MKGAQKQQTDGPVLDKAVIAEGKHVNSEAMGEKSGPNGCRSTELGDLPESSVASILSLTTPRDVARLACVSRSFRAASESDGVWQMMLPASYAGILAQAPNAPASTCSKKEVYNFLSSRVLLQNGTRDYWLDRATGAACQSIGARNLNVIWGGDDRYWEWCSKEGSRFTEVAYLKYVWWLEVKGKWQCSLSPGTYTFSWRLSMNGRGNHYDKIGPVTFSFEATGNEPVNTQCLLTREGARTSTGPSGTSEGRQQPLGYRWHRDAWMDLDVGEFTVESEDSPFEIEFHLKEIDCSRVKGALHIDGVGIRPSFTIQSRISLSELEIVNEPRFRHRRPRPRTVIP